MAKEQRRYTDEERATLVAMLIGEGYPTARGALQKVADSAGVSPDVLRRWFKRTQNPPPATLVGQKRTDLAKHLEEVAHVLLDAIPSKVDDAYLSNVTDSLDRLIDKIQLLRGKPTERSEIIDGSLTDAERASRATALFERARARRTGQPARTDD